MGRLYCDSAQGHLYREAANTWVRAEIDHDNDPCELQNSKQFYDPRFDPGELVRVVTVTEPVWSQGVCRYIKSEQRADGNSWIMLGTDLGVKWVRDEWVVLKGICGACEQPCKDKDYLCVRCRSEYE